MVKIKTQYYVYMVRCADETFYIGITTDVERRIAEHNGDGGTKKGAKYTRARQPVHLVYVASFPDRSHATKEELRLKKLTRREKEVFLQRETRHKRKKRIVETYKG